MSDADKVLKILIDLEVINKKDAEAAKDLLKQTGKEAEGAGEGFGELNLHGKEANHVFGALNKLIPGLGSELKALVVGGGPLVVFMLLLEAIKTNYDFLKEASEASASAQVAAAERVRAALHKAADEASKFAAAQANAKKPADEYATSLSDQNIKLDAQFTALKKIVAAQKEIDLAQAKTPEQQQAVKDKYAGIEGGNEKAQELAKQQALNNVIAKLQADLAHLLSERQTLLALQHDQSAAVTELNKQLADLEAKLQILTGPKTAVYGQFSGAPGLGAEELPGKIEDLSKKQSAVASELNKNTTSLSKVNQVIVDLTSKLRDYTHQFSINKQVGEINDQGRSAVEILNFRGEKSNQTLGELEAVLNLTESQRLTILERIIKGQLSAQAAVSQLASRLSQVEQQVRYTGGNGQQ